MKKADITKIAIDMINDNSTDIQSHLLILDKGNEAVLAIWTLLLALYKDFVKETGVDKTKGWTLYFQPHLEKTYPKRGWGIKTMQSYNRVVKDPKKTKEYLAGEFELSSGRKKVVKKLSEEQKLLNAVTAFNNLVSKIIDTGKKVVVSTTTAGLLSVEVK